MPLSVNDIRLSINQDESSLRRITAKTLGIPENAITSLSVKRISLDARKKNDISFLYSLELSLSPHDEAALLRRALPGVEAVRQNAVGEPVFGNQRAEKPIVIAGLGPAGLFAAFTLAKYGYRPIVIERGRPINERTRDVEAFWGGGGLNTESNIMFGEGGAGTYSDGKLTTRIKDARAHEVINILAAHGAPARIRQLAKPHIGTDMLVKTVQSMREDIISMGGEVRFSTRLTGIKGDAKGNISSITVECGANTESIPCAACILAIGQGARDTYRMLSEAGLELLPKAFAVGVRIEHPREMIDRSQYGEFAGHPRLGAAEYRLADKAGERGVYTFCMCPGGHVVASSSGAEQVVTNGMSCYARDAENSNSAVVVQVDSRDFGTGPLDGMRFQEEIERAAFFAAGGDYTAPAERVADFLKKSGSPGGFGAVKPTYRPGVAPRDLYKCLPDFVANGVAVGISAFGRRLKDFDMGDAVITAVESRTSSPVRIARDEQGEATRLHGLYPVGEGAGYAGGIVSAAVDGMRAAERIMALYRPE